MKPDKQRVLIVDGHGDSTEMAPLFFETKSCEVFIANETAEGSAPAMGGRFSGKVTHYGVECPYRRRPREREVEQ